MAILDYGRDDIDKAIRDIGNELWEKARNAAPKLVLNAVAEEARKVGVDPGYVLWALLNDRRTWSSLPDASDLDAAIRLYVESVSTSGNIDYALPEGLEGERAVNRAIKAISKWASIGFMSEMTELLFDVAKPKLKIVQQAWEQMEGERLSPRAAMAMIMRELPLRVMDHPFWFRDAHTLTLLSKGILGAP